MLQKSTAFPLTGATDNPLTFFPPHWQKLEAA